MICAKVLPVIRKKRGWKFIHFYLRRPFYNLFIYFRKIGKISTGLKLGISFFIKVPLSSGKTKAILASSGIGLSHFNFEKKVGMAKVLGSLPQECLPVFKWIFLLKMTSIARKKNWFISSPLSFHFLVFVAVASGLLWIWKWF